MNSDFEQLADSLKLPSAWDSSPLPGAAAFAAYYNTLKERMRQTRSVSDLVSNGVNACLLALDTINIHGMDHRPSAQAMVAAARNVLSGWGLEIKPLAAAPVAPAEAVWPPESSKLPPLPAVYYERYYVVKEDMTYGGVTVVGGTQLILKSSYWNHDDGVWGMQFLEFGKADEPANRFWLNSALVRPADATAADAPVATAASEGRK